METVSSVSMYGYVEGSKDNESSELYTHWEFAALIQFLKTFGEHLQIDEFPTELLESSMLYNPNNTFLVTLHIKLLRSLGQHHVGLHDWQLSLAKEFLKRADEIDVNLVPQDFDYARCPVYNKVLILYYLCEWQLIDIDRFRLKIKDDEGSFEWRVDPIGWDAKWNTYWLFDDHHLYREKYQDPAVLSGEKKITKKLNSITVPPSWELVCATAEQWENLPLQFKATRNANEKALMAVIKEDLIPNILPELQTLEKQRRKQDLLDNMPRKRSARLIMKEIEQLDNRKLGEILDVDILLAEEQSIKERIALEQEENDRQRKLHERDERIRQREDRVRQQEEDRIMKEIELQRQREERAEERERRKAGEFNGDRNKISQLPSICSQDHVDVEMVDGDAQIMFANAKIPIIPKKNRPGAPKKKINPIKLSIPAHIPMKRVNSHELLYGNGISVDLNLGEWYFDCACGAHGKNYDDGMEMIECVVCRVWQHVTCVVKNDAVKSHLQDVDFLCTSCQNRRAKNALRKAKLAASLPAREEMRLKKIAERDRLKAETNMAAAQMATLIPLDGKKALGDKTTPIVSSYFSTHVPEIINFSPPTPYNPAMAASANSYHSTQPVSNFLPTVSTTSSFNTPHRSVMPIYSHGIHDGGDRRMMLLSEVASSAKPLPVLSPTSFPNCQEHRGGYQKSTEYRSLVAKTDTCNIPNSILHPTQMTKELPVVDIVPENYSKVTVEDICMTSLQSISDPAKPDQHVEKIDVHAVEVDSSARDFPLGMHNITSMSEQPTAPH